MEEKLKRLDDILQARVRYVHKWNAVTLDINGTTFTVKWHCHVDDPLNSALFMSTTYPKEYVDIYIKEQLKKLKRDIPVNELAILKEL